MQFNKHFWDWSQGVRNIADDIIVWGNSQREHDEHLETLLIYSYTSSRGFFRYFPWVRFLHRRLSLSELQGVWGRSPLKYMSTPYDRGFLYSFTKYVMLYVRKRIISRKSQRLLMLTAGMLMDTIHCIVFIVLCCISAFSFVMSLNQTTSF